jgi:MFS superfamily sulfate permease-like transporter
VGRCDRGFGAADSRDLCRARDWAILQPVLAAVVIAALTHALNPAPILRLFQIRRDGWVAVAATMGVLTLGVLNGMLAAIALSIAMLLYDLAHPSVSTLGRWATAMTMSILPRHEDAAPPRGIALFRPMRPVFRQCGKRAGRHAARCRLQRAGGGAQPEESNDLDATAIDALGEFVLGRQQDGQRVVLARAHDRFVMC